MQCIPYYYCHYLLLPLLLCNVGCCYSMTTSLSLLSSSSMASSKELRVPKEWSKYHHDLVDESINPELFSEDELINLIIALGLSDSKVKTKKFFDSCRPYHMNRYVYVFIPDNSMSKNIFRPFAYLCLTIFMSDDLMETMSVSEMRQICDAFQKLDQEICKQFPQFPTLAQMKQSLEAENVNEMVMPHVLHLLQFTNSIGKTLIEEGNFLPEDVKDYWRRLVMVTGFYAEGVKSESIQGVTTSMDEYLWRRVMSGRQKGVRQESLRTKKWLGKEKPQTRAAWFQCLHFIHITLNINSVKTEYITSSKMGEKLLISSMISYSGKFF